MGQIGKFASQIGGQLLSQGVQQLFSGIQNGTMGGPADIMNTAQTGAFSSQLAVAATQEQSATLINKNSNNDPLPVIYGEKRIGGVRIHAETNDGAGNSEGTEYLFQVIALCEGEMTSLEEVWWDDTLIWFNSHDDEVQINHIDHGDYWELQEYFSNASNPDYYGDGTTINGKNVYIHWYKGKDTQAGSTFFSGLSQDWTTSHRLQGISYVIMALQADPETYKNGLPTMTFTVRGKKMYNVDDLADDPQNPNDAIYYPGLDTVMDYTAEDPGPYTIGRRDWMNPVDALYDYMTNTRYGKGLDHDENGVFTPGLDIDLSSWQTQRQYAEGRFSIGGAVNTGAKLFDNVELLANCANAFLIYSNGKYRLKIPKEDEYLEQTREMIIEEREMLSAFTVNYAGKKDVLNTVHVSFSDPESQYNDEIAIIQDATALAEDGNQVHDIKIDMPLITNRELIENFAQFKIDRSRLAKLYSFELPHSYITLEVGDIVRLQHRYLPSSGQPIRILSLTLTADDKIQVVAEPDLAWLTDYFPILTPSF